MTNPPLNAVSIHAMMFIRLPLRDPDTGIGSNARNLSSTNPFTVAPSDVKRRAMTDFDRV
jgi:hypothetical protein